MQDQDKTKEQMMKEPAGTPSDATRPEVAWKATDSMESRYCEIISSLSDAVYIVQDGWVKFANQACAELTGYSLEEGMNANAIQAFVHQDDREMVEQYHKRRSMGDITPHRYEFRIRCKDGSLKWIELKSTLILWEGRPAGLGVATDITDHKRMEDALRSSEERFRTLFQTANDAIFILEGNKFVECNARALEFFGCTQDKDLLGHTPMEFSPEMQPDGATSTQKAQSYIEAASNSNPQRFYWKHCRRDGALFDAEVSLNSLFLQGKAHIQAIARDITERMQAEEKLRSTVSRFYTILSNLYGGVLLVSNEGLVEFANQSFCDLFGLDDAPEDLNGLNGPQMIEKIGGVVGDAWVARVLETIAANQPVKSEEITTADGRTYIRDFIPIVVDGKPYGRIWHHTDVSERRSTEKALKKLEDRYRNVSSITSDIAYSCSKSATSAYSLDWMTGPTESIIGYSEDNLIDLGCWRNLVLNDDLPVFDKHVIGIAPGSTDSCELRLRHKNGNMVWVHSSTKCVCDSESPDGFRLYGGITDITQRKQMENALIRSEETYRQLAENTRDVIWQTDPNLVFTYVNPAIYQMTGYTQSEWIGTRLSDHCDEKNFRKMAGVASAAILKHNDHPDIYVEAVILKKNREPFPVEIVGKVMCGDDGLPTTLQGVTRDITERKRADEKNLRLAAIVDSSDDAIVACSLDGIVTNWNRGAENTFGYGEHEMVGKHITTLAPQGRDHEIQGVLEQVGTGKAVKVSEALRRRKDGGVIPVSLRVSPIIDHENVIIGASAIIRDISDRVKALQEKEALQVQLFQAQKMEALGTLVGGIAHDFNNMLQAVIGYSEILLADKKAGEQGFRELNAIISTGEGGADLVKKLLAFAQESLGSPKDFDLNRQILNTFKIMSRTFSPQIELELNLSSHPNFVHADTNQIDQILMNLAINASEAMPDGGRLRVETRHVSLDEDYCRVNSGVKSGEYVMLSVADTGRGMDAATLDKIFDPFFSTKERGATRGTGLGLSVARGLVNKHGGHIACKSEPGKGTEFRIYFPAVETPQCATGVTVPELKPVKPDTILVVEDNRSIAELATTALESEGYKVIVSADGQEALDVYKTRNEEISLVVLDLLMPKMSGKECLMGMRRICPSVRVIIASGYSPGDEFHDEIKPFVRGFLQKPFRIAALINEVRSALKAE